MTEVEIVCPFPPHQLNPNSRPHYMEKARIRSAYRTECYIEARVAKHAEELAGAVFPLVPADCYLTFVLPDRRRRDTDNLVSAFKSGIDALVSAGLIADDSSDALTLKQPAIEYGNPAVKVRLVAP